MPFATLFGHEGDGWVGSKLLPPLGCDPGRADGCLESLRSRETETVLLGTLLLLGRPDGLRKEDLPKELSSHGP